MRSLFLATALIAATAGTLPAIAQDIATVRSGQTLVSADGRRMGKISRIISDTAGQPVSATIIVDTRFVSVPISTLSIGEDNRVKTTLSRAEIRKLK